MELTLWPVRCIHCGKVIGGMQKKYYELLRQNVSPEESLLRFQRILSDKLYKFYILLHQNITPEEALDKTGIVLSNEEKQYLLRPNVNPIKDQTDQNIYLFRLNISIEEAQDRLEKILNNKEKEYSNLLHQKVAPVEALEKIGILLSKQEEQYLLPENITPAEALNRLGLTRTCCRMTVINLPQIAPGYLIPSSEEETAARVLVTPERTHTQEGVLPAMQTNAPITGRVTRLPRFSETRILAPSKMNKAAARTIIKPAAPSAEVIQPQIRRRFPAI